MTDLLFVYGTLMRGEVRHHFIADAEYLGEAETQGELYNCGEYPAMRLTGTNAVKGELYRLPSLDRLRVLDEEEGYNGEGAPDSWFRRTLVSVGSQMAWAYLDASAVGPDTPRIASGSWRTRQ